MKLIAYKETWCDYLTPCHHKKDVMVGDYDCEHCEYFKGRQNINNNIEKFTKAHRPSDEDYYKRYTLVNLGCIYCDFKK